MIETLKAMGFDTTRLRWNTPDGVIAAIVSYAQAKAHPPTRPNPVDPQYATGPALPFADRQGVAARLVRAQMTAKAARMARVLSGDPVGQEALRRLNAKSK
ncbi:hypothetical protein [Gemmata sp.]|uniref:hypothetical protein n=1 Tax=Gemmata sp. TaxID=1914242 RepID=UPI003F6EA3CE